MSESFLGRWSRRKQAPVEAVEAEDARIAREQAEAEAALRPPAGTAAQAPAESSPQAPPELPPVESLTRDADFSAFMKPEVPPQMKNAALKKLFSDPHFNVMDGLDTYIDDYTREDPIPEAMLRSLVQSRTLKLFDYSKEEAQEAQEAKEVAEKLAREQAGQGVTPAAPGAVPTDQAALPQAGTTPPSPPGETDATRVAAARLPDPDGAAH